MSGNVVCLPAPARRVVGFVLEFPRTSADGEYLAFHIEKHTTRVFLWDGYRVLVESMRENEFGMCKFELVVVV